MPSKSCAIIGCDTKYNDKTTLRHRFPKDQAIFDIWVKRSGNNKLLNKPLDLVYKSSVICDKHFEQNCRSPGFKKLVHNSVPTLNLPGMTEEIASTKNSSIIQIADEL
ncbi:uncharacterized protein LOC112596372 [Melanaphis sacchari]|uniref:uncharacterized protein LOC112596372 n=1 Tax=Melanaphis sacchari TaxID=742174 RepID=UPI000DC13E36|nr:uncharacterized protein LOC112596372 [Melanaphis sacchari]XP_025197803.1 uncharacterized protein LOC112596372 [Melanaphis sacchari]XP_025197804.1 uncharacterized protein LOC112596372 [Melanaphis sacchari]